MLKDLLFLVSFYSNDRDRLILKLYCNIYFKFINDFKLCCINNEIISINILLLTNAKLDWNRGLELACIGNGPHHINLVDFMIQKGETEVPPFRWANSWNCGLRTTRKCSGIDFIVLQSV